MTDNLEQLSDDQLYEHLQFVLAEIETRNPALREAATKAQVSAYDRMMIAGQAAEKESIRLKRLEAQDIANRAAEEVRNRSEEQKSEAARIAATEAAAKAAKRITLRQEEDKRLLARAADLLDLSPSDICIAEVPGYKESGARVVINEGHDKYQKNHLVDWSSKSGDIKTKRNYINKKPELAALCAELKQTLWARHYESSNSTTRNYAFLDGADYLWSPKEEQ
jgi:hypothetical protein